jgi:hypothetical protein
VSVAGGVVGCQSKKAESFTQKPRHVPPRPPTGVRPLGNICPKHGITDNLQDRSSDRARSYNILSQNRLRNITNGMAHDMLLVVIPHERGQIGLSNVVGLRCTLRPS